MKYAGGHTAAAPQRGRTHIRALNRQAAAAQHACPCGTIVATQGQICPACLNSAPQALLQLLLSPDLNARQRARVEIAKHATSRAGNPYPPYDINLNQTMLKSEAAI